MRLLVSGYYGIVERRRDIALAILKGVRAGLAGRDTP
jgi:hypothetical protein